MIIFKKRTLIYEKGGGGSAGVVDFPDYMKTLHGRLLDHSGVDTITSSLVDVMNSSLGNSPFSAADAYDPDSDIASMVSAIDDLDTLVTALSSTTTLDTLVTRVLSTTYIDDAVDEYSADLADRFTSEVLPRFEAGMRDINAVVSSAFVNGRAIMEVSQTRQVAKFSAGLHLKSSTDDALRLITLKLEYQKMLSHLAIDTYRLKIVAKSEEVETNFELDESDALWDLNVFQHGGNLLASISGASGWLGGKKKSKGQSALGGALAGAAGGAMVGGAPGAIIGAIFGAASGLFGD